MSVYNAGNLPSGLNSLTSVRATYRLPDDPMIVHAGGINRERDLETLLEALSRIASTHRLHLAVAGEGDRRYVESLRHLAIQLGIGNRVTFLGRINREDALALMCQSWAGVVTLESNPLTELAWPARIAEYAQLDKALVVPRLRFLERMLQDAAVYYVPGDSVSLSAALESLLDHPEVGEMLRARMQALPTRASWMNGKASLLGLYDRLVAIPAG